MKILVTGADGFIGSHLTEALVRGGHDVRAFVLYNSFGSRGWLDHVGADVRGALEIVAGDIRDPHGVREAVTGCSKVLHLAALIAIPFSYRSPDAYVETNVRGTLNLLQAARDRGVERFIQTSTSEVYGTARSVPIDEHHPLQGQSPYSATKIAADQMAYSFHASFGLPVVIVRPFNTYGPRQSARAVIPTIITQVAAGLRRIELGSLTPTRDFSYVGDTVDGFIAALESRDGLGEVVNLGSNHEISIGDVATLVARLMGVEIDVQLDDERLRPQSSEVERLLADNRKALRLFGWKPAMSGREGLERGLLRTIEWFADPANLARYRPGEYAI
jgi:dTDP-glucose 4,6-dehydratase